MRLNVNHQAFMALVSAGLWEKEVSLSSYGEIDLNAIYKLAQEQSVVGLLTAGLEHVTDVKVPQVLALTIAGEVLQLEQRNRAMNEFVARLIEDLRKDDVYTLLVKGQGVAQCYERPLWRACGDVDLLLSDNNYKKAFESLKLLASSVENERSFTKHQALTIDGWKVELHGTLRSGLWKRLEHVVDDVQANVFYGGSVRSWQNGQIQVFLPGVDEDVFFVFSHILQHFFKGGIGLRQICDWCRLLWTYKDSIDSRLLEYRLISAGVSSEWKAFAALAVGKLGMPADAMPLYDEDEKWKRKAEDILDCIIETGNFGHNRDVSYQKNTPIIQRKLISLWRQTKDSLRHAGIFPLDSMKAWWSIFVAGVKDAVRGEKI